MLINNVQVKPSRIVLKDEIIIVKKPPVVYSFRVLEPIENRVSAKLVDSFLEDLTPEEEKEKLNIRLSSGVIFREKGSGRPTKKDRRDIDRLKTNFNSL